MPTNEPPITKSSILGIDNGKDWVLGISSNQGVIMKEENEHIK